MEEDLFCTLPRSADFSPESMGTEPKVRGHFGMGTDGKIGWGCGRGYTLGQTADQCHHSVKHRRQKRPTVTCILRWIVKKNDTTGRGPDAIRSIRVDNASKNGTEQNNRAFNFFIYNERGWCGE